MKHETQTSVLVSITSAALKDAALLFCMLSDGCVSEFCIATLNFDSKLVFVTTSVFKNVQKSAEKPVIALKANEIGYICRFMLEWYRDGVGRVDHVDIDVF
ncbi:MAG: hypothetical protein U0640_08495 [Phycisphaerales bacterium]